MTVNWNIPRDIIMKIHRTEYNPFFNSIDIYTCGCKDHPCVGCFNPELWNFNQGTFYTDFFPSLEKKIKDLEVKSSFLFGGEPLDNNYTDILQLCSFLKKLDLTVYLFTHYEVSFVLDLIKSNKFSGNLLFYVDYLKCGIYDQTLKTANNIQYGIKLASSNQHIYCTKDLI